LLPAGTPGRYNDSHAYLSGFPNNHRVETTISLGALWSGDLEVEILLGWSVSGSVRSPEPFYGPTHSDGIECNIFWSPGSYFGCYASRWLDQNPTLDATAGLNGLGGIQNGDIFCAQLVLGSGVGTVTLSIIRSGVENVFGSLTDANFFRVGQPGFGFYRQDLGGTPDPTRFALTDFTARGL
jgi:hypothetical protein